MRTVTDGGRTVTYTRDEVAALGGGPDHRVRLSDRRRESFADTFYITDGTLPREAEIQALRAGNWRLASVALVLTGPRESGSDGAGDGKYAAGQLLLSAAESRAIAHALILAADEADRLPD